MEVIRKEQLFWEVIIGEDWQSSDSSEFRPLRN